MESLLRSSLKAMQTVVGADTTLEKNLKVRYRAARHLVQGTVVGKQYTAVKSRMQKRYFAENHAIFWAGDPRASRIGIYTFGSCDLPSVFSAIPSIRQVLNGTCSIAREGIISYSRSDVMMQSLGELPEDAVAATVEKMGLGASYFQPRLFAKTFTVASPAGPQEFPKNLITLSITADSTRVLYRHKEHGFLVDPGGWWLNQSMERVMADRSSVNWFRENFVKVGRISLEDFADNFSQVVRLLKEKTGAHVMVFNVSAVDPGSKTHCYQFVKDPHNLRRLEFNLALAELSRKLDFPIVDVDRIVKRVGMSNLQVDFGHLPPKAYEPIGREAFGIMRELKIF
jgi:hypothetical protein